MPDHHVRQPFLVRLRCAEPKHRSIAKERSRSFYSCDAALRKMPHSAFSFCEVVVTPANPYARRRPDTQIEIEIEKERERERGFMLHSEWATVLTAVTENNMQHSQRPAKTQASLTTFQVRREDGSDSERHGIKIHKLFFFFFCFAAIPD